MTKENLCIGVTRDVALDLVAAIACVSPSARLAADVRMVEMHLQESANYFARQVRSAEGKALKPTPAEVVHEILTRAPDSVPARVWQMVLIDSRLAIASCPACGLVRLESWPEGATCARADVNEMCDDCAERQREYAEHPLEG